MGKIRNKPTKPIEPEDLEKAEIIVDSLTTSTIVEKEKDDPYDGLTERQKLIARMRLRGASQTTIAKTLNLSQPLVCREIKIIREHMATRGSSIDQAATIGET